MTAASTEEAVLIRSAQAGDRTAFRELYERHVEAIFRFAACRVGHHEAEDLTAETFARAWTALPRYEDRGLPFGAWLFRILRNLMNSAGRRAREMPGEVVPDRTHEAAEQKALRQIDQQDVLLSLASLADRHRMVLELRFLHERSVAEVAADLDMTDEAVRALTYRALKALRDLQLAGD